VIVTLTTGRMIVSVTNSPTAEVSSVFLSLARHLYWWTISHREYHPSSCQCFYHWIDTSAVGLLVTETIIRPVVSDTITGSTLLLLTGRMIVSVTNSPTAEVSIQ
jgi:hypothetical protein